ncbi:serine/threonine-protein kinase RIO2-like [Dermatophagoides farinae]|uniref:serine/threonine-protein kinase RIO2-like n=1 Tax=Dermatophagoides farinae TaxID=6954 RepID=UPI003F605262
MLKYEFAPKSALQSNIKLRKLPLKQLLGDLLNFDLLTYEGVKVHQGYRLTWKGFDYLALHHIIGAGLITSVGPRIGIGKEADIHIILIDIAKLGYVHGDYNEFNIIVDEENVVSANSITIIDFPQCLKTSHHAAPEYFDRDSMSIKLFFERRFKYVLDQIPTWADIQAELNLSELDSNEADFNSGQDEEKSDGEEIFEVLQSDIENEENHEISK